MNKVGGPPNPRSLESDFSPACTCFFNTRQGGSWPWFITCPVKCPLFFFSLKIQTLTENVNRPPLLLHGLFLLANTCENSHVFAHQRCLIQDDRAVLHVSVRGAKPPKPNETRWETTRPAPCPRQCVVTSFECASSEKAKGVNPICEPGLANGKAFHTSLILPPWPDHLKATGFPHPHPPPLLRALPFLKQNRHGKRTQIPGGETGPASGNCSAWAPKPPSWWQLNEAKRPWGSSYFGFFSIWGEPLSQWRQRHHLSDAQSVFTPCRALYICGLL